MLSPEFLRAKFEAGLTYDAYVDSGKEADRAAWRAFQAGAHLTPDQRRLIESFRRQINILVVSGTWCGDCVKQIPFLKLIEDANPQRIRARYVDRDQHRDLAERVMLCGGLRVPVVLLLNEDFDLMSLEGDRSLTRYRALAARQLGAACELPHAPTAASEVAETLADWVDSVERVHLMARLSTKLRERYRD